VNGLVYQQDDVGPAIYYVEGLDSIGEICSFCNEKGAFLMKRWPFFHVLTEIKSGYNLILC
jgi:hypothetical protein